MRLMSRGWRRVVIGVILVGTPLLPIPFRALASDPALRVSRYLLLEGSSLVDSCLICGRPDIFLPMRGTFDLRLLNENPLFSRYALENISFTAGAGFGREYKLTGKGVYEFGGEVALRQTLFLEARLTQDGADQLTYFTNETGLVQRRWPMLEVAVRQTNGTLLQTFHLTICAAPIRELWFSTANGMTSGKLPPPDNRISAGDLLSFAGRRVKANYELTGRLGVMPVVPDLGLDAVDIIPGPEIIFSIEENVFSERLGPLQQGDLLSARGRIVQRNQDLTRAFVLMPPAPDVGLDAAQLRDDGEVLFSIEHEVFSEGLGQVLGRGDLLSSTGRVVRSQKDLLSHFHPPHSPGSPERDYGLDAFYLWPSGEIWFSLETGFQDGQRGPVQPGDLLSDQGYIVFRNLELVSAFAPVEDLADFGLDGLFIVTDVLPPAAPPHFTRVLPQRARGDLRLEWRNSGRALQVESAERVTGPFTPLSEIIPDTFFEDPGVLRQQPRRFYRLRQW